MSPLTRRQRQALECVRHQGCLLQDLGGNAHMTTLSVLAGHGLVSVQIKITPAGLVRLIREGQRHEVSR